MRAWTLGWMALFCFTTLVTAQPPLSATPAESADPAAASIPAASPAASGSSSIPSPPPPPARPTMIKFAEQLSFLLQNIPSFGNPPPDQRNRVVQSLNQLKVSSHMVQPTMQLYTVDPVMRYLILDLPKQFTAIETAYTAGQYTQARYLLRRTTQTCVACHSASSNKNSAVLSFPEPMVGIGNLERAEYYAATRRHEDAMLAYEKALQDKDFKATQPERWNEALANLIAITIRLRNSPHMTLEMISSRMEEPGLRPEQKAMLQAWRASAKAWTQEKLNVKLSPADMLLKAQSLSEQAKQIAKKNPSFAYVDSLRVMTLLNEIAMSPEADVLKAESFYMAGETAQKLKDIQIWSHPEAYYEACIRAKPHSPESQKCWAALKNSIAQDKSLSLSAELSKQLSDLAL